jgi:hypothetical protein
MFTYRQPDSWPAAAVAAVETPERSVPPCLPLMVNAAVL